MDVTAPALCAGWMIGAVPEGLTIIGPDREVVVRLDGDARPLGAALAAGENRPPSAMEGGEHDAEYARLLALLDELGAFAERPAMTVGAPGQTLAVAVAAARAGAAPAGIVHTAEEALALPAGAAPGTRRRALHAFVRGLRPDGRLQAYALAWHGRGQVWGDELTAEALAACPSVPGTLIEVVELRDGGQRWTVEPDALDRLGARTAHRLGTILRTWPPEPLLPDDERGPWLCVTETAAGSLEAPAPARDRIAQGIGTPEHAALVARAEGAERYASADASQAEIVTARRSELPGAIGPDEFYARAPVTDTGDDPVRGWCPAVARDGTRHWVPVETVYTSARPPGPTLPWTGSGVAAHPDGAEARRRAFRELIERDAFMWTWIQRASRARVIATSVPDDVRALARRLEADCWRTTWVDLTLDTLPVLLCGLVHPQEGLTLAAACHPDPVRALRRATEEALVLATRLRPDPDARPAAHAVRTPYEHLSYHRDPSRWPEHGFLLSGQEEVALEDLPHPEHGDAEALLEELGHRPMTVDLSLPACAPFRVVRALAPGLLPLTFGAGHEPTGLARARSPLVTRDGRAWGAPLAGTTISGMLPHPFP